MKKQAVRHQIVEHLSRLGDASLHKVGNSEDEFAEVYHYHNTLEVVIVRQGWVEGVVGGVMGTMTRDMIVVIGDDMPHCVLRASKNCRLLLVHVPAELLKWDEERFPELAHGVDYIRCSKSGMVYHDARLADQLARLAVKIDAAEGFMRMSLMMKLLHILSTTLPSSTILAVQQQGSTMKEKDSCVDRAYRYLYEHFRRTFSLDELAAYAGLTPSALCRSFRKASGSTIGEFCSRLRIEYACNLLLTTSLDVSQIAYQSGYSSYPHFFTQFKRAMKTTPTAYRQRSQGGR